MSRWYRLGMVALMLSAVGVCGMSSSLESQMLEGSGQPVAKGGPTQGRFTKTSDGVITDMLTDLDWYVSPNQDNNWHQAKAWTENLTVAGGGWRLPDMMELKALYQKGASPIHMDPVFQIPGAWVWSGQLKDASFAWGFAFYSGLEGWHSVDYGFGRVVLAVRSRR